VRRCRISRRAEPAPDPLWETSISLMRSSHHVICTFGHVMLNFNHSTVKRALQNMRNDCHQWLSHSFGVHQIRFRQPRTPLGSLQRSPRHTSWFKGDPTSKGKGRGMAPLTQILTQVTLLRTPASSHYLNVLVDVSKNVSAVVELYSNEMLRFLLASSASAG